MRITLATLGTLTAAAAFSFTGLVSTPASVSAAPNGQRPVLVRPLHAQGALVPRARWAQGISGPLLYVGVYDNGQGFAVVQIYSLNTHKQVGQISGLGFPTSMTVDGAGNLYVVEQAVSQPEILVFPPGATSPSRTISQAGYEPNDVAIGPDGSIYVANFCQGDNISGCTGDGYTVKYPPVGSPTFYDVVGAPAFLAVRSTNQLIIEGDRSAPVGDFPKIKPLTVASEGTGYRILHLPGAKESSFPRIKFDRQDRLALLAGGYDDFSFLQVIKPPYSRPVGTLQLGALAFDFAFPKAGSHVWTGLFSSGNSVGIAEELTYPGGKVVTSFPVADAYGSNGYPLCIAVSP
jgi:hypothetical protein